MSGLQASAARASGVDVRENGTALRVATSTPHLVSLGTGRLSTAVTLHPIKQGRVTIGSDPTCDVYVTGTGVANVHCRVENSHGVVTLYPVSGCTQLDGALVDRPTRLAQGCMLTIGRSNYLRFNHPAEAKLMKSVLPSGHLSVAQIQFESEEQGGYAKPEPIQCYANNQPQKFKESLSQLDRELDMTLKELQGKKKPPVVPRKPFFDYDSSDDKPKMSSIMAKVSKFEYYAKSQQKTVGRSQFYTHENEISPKVFSSNSLTVNTPAKDVLGKSVPANFAANDKVVNVNENNQSRSYSNVAVKPRTRIDEIVRNFDESFNKLPKKVNNDEQDHIYGRINVNYDNANLVKPSNDVKSNLDDSRTEQTSLDVSWRNDRNVNVLKPTLPSPSFDRDPQYSPVYANSIQMERSFESENRRVQARQDRVTEQIQRDAETARLEEILTMCAEYERQISGSPITPTEKRAHNKIITNGSLPRGAHAPNLVQTSDGYYKFETTTTRNSSAAKSIPIPRNVSSYENIDVTQLPLEQRTPEVKIKSNGEIRDLSIPLKEENFKNDLSSPILIRKFQNGDIMSPVGSPYENLNKSNFKPKSPNTQSPRTRIKTTFAHKNLPSPQYFVFPTPPPVDNSKKPSFVIPDKTRDDKPNDVTDGKLTDVKEEDESAKPSAEKETKTGIEKQLSLEEDIPMIDDTELSDNIEFRSSVVEKEEEPISIRKNQSFDDVKKELMADIPELDEFEKDLKENREKIIQNIAEGIKSMDVEGNSRESSATLDDNVNDLRDRYEVLKEDRRRLISEIHEIKCKMTEIRSQEDDILRELEMEKALIKGEYDSEIAILNIEQKKKTDLLEQAKKIEQEIRRLKERQEARQNELSNRVEIATLKVERIQQDVRENSATNEELQNARDILDNETKIFEDLEFQHLEEESELLANREDLQNEVAVLAKKIDAQKSRILTLRSEASNNLTSALDETKVLRAEYVKHLNQVEDLTSKVQVLEKELKPLVNKLNEIERTQSPDSAFYTDQTRAKSGEFGYSPQSSDEDIDINKIDERHSKNIKDKFNSMDQMSQSMIVDIERREIGDVFDDRITESPSKSKKGFWERNFDSLKRKKKPKSPEKHDIMSQSLNENMLEENIETDSVERYNSLRFKKKPNGPMKSHSSSKIPTFAALGKIIRKDSYKRREEAKQTALDKAKKEIPPIDYEEKTSPEKQPARTLHRKSCGDEPSGQSEPKLTESNKMPSQDDIDRISKVTLDAPILSSEDLNSLCKKTVDSLKEVERKRFEMLEEQGCQVIENEREKISELKRRAQRETKQLWDERRRTRSVDSDTCQLDSESCQVPNYSCQVPSDSCQEAAPVAGDGRAQQSFDEFNATNSGCFDESSGFLSSIDERQVRDSAESAEDDRRSDDSRPLSHASDFSRENVLSLPGAPRRRRPAPLESRPLTRYLPVDRDDFDLRRHVESAGHQPALCPHVSVGAGACRGYLHKLGAKLHTWSKRWFVFDRDTKTFVYYWDKSERKPRGGAYFQVIEEVYLDHGNTSKSPSPQTTFIVKTRQRKYYLMAPSGEAARIWIDVIFTGAQGYTEYLE